MSPVFVHNKKYGEQRYKRLEFPVVIDNDLTCWVKSHTFYIPRGLFKSERLHKFNEVITTNYTYAKFNEMSSLFLKRENKEWLSKNNMKIIEKNKNVDVKQLKYEFSECDESKSSLSFDDDESSIPSTHLFLSFSNESWFDASFRL